MRSRFLSFLSMGVHSECTEPWPCAFAQRIQAVSAPHLSIDLVRHDHLAHPLQLSSLGLEFA